jgi:hypothetical protein
MRKQTITIKEHPEDGAAFPMAMFTIYRGTFPKREAIAWTTERAHAEYIAKALLASYADGEIKRIWGKAEEADAYR